MAVKVVSLARVFKFNGATFKDPDPKMTPLEVRDLLSAIHPDLTTAEVSEPSMENGRLVYQFVTAVRTKG